MTINVHAAKTHFSRLLRRVEGGQEVTIARDGRPVAKLVPVPRAKQPRKLGGMEGKIWMARDFNAPDPEIERLFYEGDIEPVAGHRRSAVEPRKPRPPRR